MTKEDAALILSIELIRLQDGETFVFSDELRITCLKIINDNVRLKQSFDYYDQNKADTP